MTGGGTILPGHRYFSAAFCALTLSLFSAPMRATDNRDSPFGIWRGESACATDAGSCHDEKVVYYIDPIPSDASAVLIQADKVVDGKAITMGKGPWKYDHARQTLTMESGGRLWQLTVTGKKIEGVLTVGNGVIFRRMALTRDDPR